MTLRRGLGASLLLLVIIGLVVWLSGRTAPNSPPPESSPVPSIATSSGGKTTQQAESTPTSIELMPTASVETPETSSPTATALPEVSFPVGAGSVDVIPHQIVRTSDDRLFIFASFPFSAELDAYWTTSPGLPNGPEAFDGYATLETSSEPLSVDAAYDGGRWVIVLANERDGELRVYPFDTVSNVFLQGSSLAQGNPTVQGDYLGSSGVSEMFDNKGSLQVAYWAGDQHIVHQSFHLDVQNGGLQAEGPTTQLDSAGSANHPVLATAPDSSLTVAWISEASGQVRILARTRDASGTWGEISVVSQGVVWHSQYFGVNIDQGPSLVVDGDGVRHLAYIEDYGTSADYGRVHYVVDSGAGWVDTPLSIWSHDPAVVPAPSGQITLIGHGHPRNATCKRMDDICYAKLGASGSWSDPEVFATAPEGLSFDSSPSVKWSGATAADVRPETIEFAFFSTPYDDPTVYYGRLP